MRKIINYITWKERLFWIDNLNDIDVKQSETKKYDFASYIIRQKSDDRQGIVITIVLYQYDKQKFKLRITMNRMFSQIVHIWKDANNWRDRNEIILEDEIIEEVSIGERHIIIRTKNRILGIGSNSTGQLGLDDYDNFDQKACFRDFVQICPKLVSNKIVQVSCGWNHTLLLDERGFVYSAGDGKSGALGHSRGVDSYEFKPVFGSIPGIKYISAGKDHSLALSSTKVYGWGSSKDGQLGLARQQIYHQPQQLLMYPSSTCYAGPKYSMFVSLKNEVYVTGYNDGGQLGLGHQKKVKIVKKIMGIEEQVIQLSGSSNYSVVRTASHQVYIAGSGCFGRFLYHTKIKYFKKCELIQMGQQFGIVKDREGGIYSWNGIKDQIPIQNQQIASLNIEKLYIGPKIVVCQQVGTSFSQNVISDNDEEKSPKEKEKKNIKEWSNGFTTKHQYFKSLAPFNIRNEKGRNIQNYQQSNNNGKSENKKLRNLHQNDEIVEQLQRNANEQQCISSPYFSRTLAREVGGGKKKKINDTGVLLQGSQSVSTPIMHRLMVLEKQNKKKDDEIKQMREQILKLMQVVNSGNDIVEQKEDMNQMLKKKEVRNWSDKQKDKFSQNLTQLRNILGTTLGQMDNSN